MLQQLRSWWPGALAGLVAIALGLAGGELVARLVDGESLVVAIGNIVIDNSPEQVTKWAIDTFGTRDKPLLIAGITVTTLALGTATGALSMHTRLAGVVVFAALAIVGGLAGAHDPLTSTADAWITAAAAGVVGIAVLFGLLLAASPRGATGDDSTDDAPAPRLERRRFLYAAGGGLATAAVSVPLVRSFISSGVDVDAQRASIVLPRPSRSSRTEQAATATATAVATATATPASATTEATATPTATPAPETTPEATATEAAAGESDAATATAEATETEVAEATPEATPESTPEPTPEATPEPTPEATPEPTPEATPEPTPVARPGPETVRGISPLVTPNDKFYRIDTALSVPRIDSSDWRLQIKGMVDSPAEFTFEELLGMSVQEESVTLACVSNKVGGRLVGNAYWLGVPLPTLLREAGVQAGATQVVGRSADGFTVGFPTDVALDGRKSMVVFGMNEEPLPASHGFPARLIVPGLYGYVSATKWLAEIELARLDTFDSYWVRRGWAQQAPIKLQSRIDVPDDGDTLDAGNVRIAGVAWGGLKGVSGVQVRPLRMHGEPPSGEDAWLDAILSEELSDSSWRQWVVDWPAAEGSFDLEVRAIDRSGMVQTAEEKPPKPNGAQGHHTISVSVRA